MLARELTGTCVGCSDLPLLICTTGGEGDINESGPGTGVDKGVVSRPRGELTGTVRPSPHIPACAISSTICLRILGGFSISTSVIVHENY